MTTVDAPNVKVFSADGTCNDVVAKGLYSDREFVAKYNLTSFNSVNTGRVIMQVVHFVYLYLKVCPGVDREVTFCVPSGGMGNSAGGVIARTMGVPLRLVCACRQRE